MQSKAKTVAEYLASLPTDRREAISAVRNLIRKHLDKGYSETMQYGMIGYSVPHSLFPAGYHCDPKQPLPFAALASQKNYMSIYLMGVYTETGNKDADWFRKAWAAAGKKLDMGKCCVRFKKLDDLALDVIAEAIRRVPAKHYIEAYVQAREQAGAATARRPTAARKVTARASTKPTAAAKRGPTKAASKTTSKAKAKPRAKARAR